MARSGSVIFCSRSIAASKAIRKISILIVDDSYRMRRAILAIRCQTNYDDAELQRAAGVAGAAVTKADLMPLRSLLVSVRECSGRFECP